MIKFDINSPPPTAEEIEAEIKHLERQRWRRESFGPACLVVFVSLLILGASTNQRVWTGGVFVSGIALSLAALLLLLGFPYTPDDKILLSIIKLEVIQKEVFCQIIESCRIDPLCDAYRLAVIRQGRQLTAGEADMLIAWAASAKSRDEKEKQHQEQAAASLALHLTEPLFTEISSQQQKATEKLKEMMEEAK